MWKVNIVILVNNLNNWFFFRVCYTWLTERFASKDFIVKKLENSFLEQFNTTIWAPLSMMGFRRTKELYIRFLFESR